MSHPDPHPTAIGPGEPSHSAGGAGELLDPGSDLSGPARWHEPDRRAVWGVEAALATLVMLLLAAFGVVLGVVWQWVTPGAGVLMTAEGPIHANPNSEHYFADDGWFALIGGVAGVVAAVACWTLVRRHRGPVVMTGMVVGCLLAAVVAWQVGRHIGLAAFRDLLEHAPAGHVFRRPARLAALGVLGVQGFAAAFTYTLLAGWSRYPTLRRPGPGEADDPVWGGFPDPRGPAGLADRTTGESPGGKEFSGAPGPPG